MTVDETQATSETEEPTETSETEETTKETSEQPDVKAMETALRKANKEAEKYRLKLKEIEDAGKSEADKLREEAEAAKRDADKARLDALKLQVGLDKELPKSLIPRLQGETEEELAADADALLRELKPTKPKGDAGGGTRGRTPDAKPDMDALLRAAARGG